MTDGSGSGFRASEDSVDGVHGQSSSNELGEPAQAALGSKAAAGMLWTTGQKWVIRVTGLVSLAVLTRLVTPEEFGVVAAAMTLLPFFYLLADLGFGTYLVQAERIDQRVLSTGLWFSLIASLVLSFATFAGAPLVSLLMDIPEVTPVLRVLTASIPLAALAAVPTALLRRRLAFRTLAVQGTIAAGVAQVVAVVLALAGFGVWALVFQLLVMQVITLALAWKAARWTPSLRFSATLFRSMATFGVRVSAADVIAGARAWAEAAIVASTLGASALGYLSIAQRLVAVVQDLSASAVMPVSVVVFARIREAPDRLRSGYIRALSLAYTVVAPLLAVLAVAAPVLVPLLYGDQWDTSIPIAQLLALAAILTVGAMLDHGLMYGLGIPGTWLKYAVLIDLATVGVTAIAVQGGLTCVAFGFLGVALAATVVRWAMVSRVLVCPVTAIAQPFLYMAATTAVSGGLGFLTLNALPTGSPLVVQVILTALVVVTSSLVLVRLLQREVVGYALVTLPIPDTLVRHARRLLLLA